MSREEKLPFGWSSREASDAAGAPIVGDQLSIRASMLYRHGAPCSDVEHVFGFRNEEGSFVFGVVPGENSVTVLTMYRAEDADEWERFERSTEVEWKDWQFNSRRAWIVCSWCANPASRLFISVKALAGSLLCRRCAGVRYRTQDASRLDRLSDRIDALRIRLDGEPANGVTCLMVPVKPHGMHDKTYRKLATELLMLEGELSEELEKRAYEVIEKNSSGIDKALAKICSWAEIAGPEPPFTLPRTLLKKGTK